MDDLSPEIRGALLAELLDGEPLRFLALLHGLQYARHLAVTRGLEDGGRLAMLAALQFVFVYLNSFRALEGVLSPLANLLRALADLDERGIVHPSLKARRAVNDHGADRAMLHGLAAAWSVALTSSGARPADADRRVADKLGDAGYRLRGEREDHGPTPVTVEEWRRHARAHGAGRPPLGVDGGFYDRMLAAFADMAPADIDAYALQSVRLFLPHLLRPEAQKPEKGGS